MIYEWAVIAVWLAAALVFCRRKRSQELAANPLKGGGGQSGAGTEIPAGSSSEGAHDRHTFDTDMGVLVIEEKGELLLLCTHKGCLAMLPVPGVVRCESALTRARMPSSRRRLPSS